MTIAEFLDLCQETQRFGIRQAKTTLIAADAVIGTTPEQPAIAAHADQETEPKPHRKFTPTFRREATPTFACQNLAGAIIRDTGAICRLS